MDERRTDPDMADAPAGAIRRGRWNQGRAAMAAISARGRAHAPDPDLAAILVEPNGYAVSDPLALIAKAPDGIQRPEDGHGGSIRGAAVGGGQAGDLGAVRAPGPAGAGLAGKAGAEAAWAWIGQHKAISGIVLLDTIAVVLWTLGIA